MLMKMTKQDLLELNLVFPIISMSGNTKFKYNVLKNIEILKPHISPLLEIEKNIKSGLEKFNSDRDNIIIKLGTKREDGSVFIDTKNQDLLLKFNLELKELSDKYKNEILEYDAKMQEFQNLLNEEVEEILVFKELSIDQLPEEGISIRQLDILEKFKIIKD